MNRRNLARLLGAVLLIVAVEGAARVVATRTVETIRWYDASTQLKIEQMDTLDDVDTVFVGTSMAWQGFVPADYSAASGVTSYNAGLAGGTPGVMRRWIVDEVVPRLHPTTVVWGLSSLDLAPNYGDENQATYDNALATRQGASARIEQWFADRSVLIRERTVLRAPSSVRGPAANLRRQQFADARRFLGTDGERLDFRPDMSDERRAVMRARLEAFAPDDDDLDRIRSTVGALKADGIDVVLVELPVPTAFVEAHPRGAADHDLVGGALSAVAAESGVRFLDMSIGFTDDDFVDLTHLDGPAAARLTTDVAAAVKSGRTDEVVVEPGSAPPADPGANGCETVTVVDEYGFEIAVCLGEGETATDDPTTDPLDDLRFVHAALLDRMALRACGAEALPIALANAAPDERQDELVEVIVALNAAHGDCDQWEPLWRASVDALATFVGITSTYPAQDGPSLAAASIDQLAIMWELAPTSNASSFWSQPNEMLAAIELRRRIEEGDPVRSGIFGSSQAAQDIDQTLVREQWDPGILSMGVGGMDAEEWALTVDDLVAEMEPEVAIWATSTHRLINDTGRDPCLTVTDKVVRVDAARERMFPWVDGSDLEILVGSESQTSPYRSTELALGAFVFDGPGNRIVESGTSFDKVGNVELNGRYVDPQLCTERLDALRGVLEGLQALDVEVILVSLPVHQALLDLAPDVHAAAVAGLAAIADDLGIPLITFEPFGDDETGDGIHANTAGRARITAELLDALPPRSG